MGYCLTKDGMDRIWEAWEQCYDIYAPKCFAGKGRFSDTDCVRYGRVHGADEIVFTQKAEYSAKEFLLPNAETLFYFTEDQVTESKEREKEMLIFLHSCDLHALKRLDAVYLEQGMIDHYYQRLREKARFVLMGCDAAFDSCFCVDMGTNQSPDYDMSVDQKDGRYYIDCNMPQWDEALSQAAESIQEVTPAFVTQTVTRITLPTQMPQKILQDDFWRQYDGRCIAWTLQFCLPHLHLFYHAGYVLYGKRKSGGKKTGMGFLYGRRVCGCCRWRHIPQKAWRTDAL